MLKGSGGKVKFQNSREGGFQGWPRVRVWVGCGKVKNTKISPRLIVGVSNRRQQYAILVLKIWTIFAYSKRKKVPALDSYAPERNYLNSKLSIGMSNDEATHAKITSRKIMIIFGGIISIIIILRFTHKRVHTKGGTTHTVWRECEFARMRIVSSFLIASRIWASIIPTKSTFLLYAVVLIPKSTLDKREMEKKEEIRFSQCYFDCFGRRSPLRLSFAISVYIRTYIHILDIPTQGAYTQSHSHPYSWDTIFIHFIYSHIREKMKQNIERNKTLQKKKRQRSKKKSEEQKK